MVAVVTEPELVDAVDEVRPGRAVLGEPIVSRRAATRRCSRRSRPARLDVGPRSADDLYILYTGGTTGRPKGVVWRHEDIYFASLGGRGTPEQGRADARPRPSRSSTGCVGGDPIMRRLPLCPLIHGGAMWIALQSLLVRRSRSCSTSTVTSIRPPRSRLLAGERVELTMLIGDATARPLADALADCGPTIRRRATCRRCR